MRRTILVLALLLLTTGLAGCLGGSDAETDGPIQKQRAQVTSDLGGIEGTVTDEAIQPIEGVNVTLVETGETAESASDGSFAFSRIDPGTYTVAVRADGFISSQQLVTVEPNDAAIVDFLLARGAIEEPFEQVVEMSGFIECGVGWTTRPSPVYAVTSNAVALCAVPQIVAENSTNDKFDVYPELEAPLDTLVYEIEIPGSGGPAGSTMLSVDMWIQGFVYDYRANLFDAGLENGDLIRLEKDAWERTSQNFTDVCQGINDTEQDDDFCGYNFWDSGWSLIIRAFADSDCLPGVVSACAPIQQEFTHYLSAFYNQQAPEGYAILS